VIFGAIIAYFAIFPNDLSFLDQLLKLTGSVAIGAYALLIAMVVVAGAVRIWGHQADVVPPARPSDRL
jgi:hypothetical protein